MLPPGSMQQASPCMGIAGKADPPPAGRIPQADTAAAGARPAA